MVNLENQAQVELEWAGKWNEMRTQIEDNKDTIPQLEREIRNQTIETTDSPTEEEGELIDNKIDGIFQRFFQKLRTQKQNFEDFCQEWRLDCRLIAMGSMLMIVVGIITIVMVIILAIKTYCMYKRVQRLWTYLDIEATKTEQEEDDNMWKTRIMEGHHGEFTPNPTRNRSQMQKNYHALNLKINQTQAQVNTVRMTCNVMNIKDESNRRGQREPVRDQELGATSPLLGQ